MASTSQPKASTGGAGGGGGDGGGSDARDRRQQEQEEQDRILAHRLHMELNMGLTPRLSCDAMRCDAMR